MGKNYKGPVRQNRIRKLDKKIKHAEEQLAVTQILKTEDAGFIEPEAGEHSVQLKQTDIKKFVDKASAQKGFHLDLRQYGPYQLDYTLNGKYLVLGGHKGHIAAFDWKAKTLLCEVGVMESVHDVQWFHNETMFAVAQKQWTYVYDNQGIEIHCLKALDRIQRLEFLPYHFLLVGGHESGFLSWLDVSIGKIVTQFGTRQGPLGVMCQNPDNAIIHCGHSNGTVTMWAPSSSKAVASVLCHGSAVNAVAVDTVGRLMATTGLDGKLRIWDLRNSFKPLCSQHTGGIPSSLSFSQQGLLAVGLKNRVSIFREVVRNEKPYLNHFPSDTVSCIKFCPFEDVLGMGSQNGFDSLLVPGAGEPNFDALERNPFQSKKQRREAEVKALLEKIPSDLISLENRALGEVDLETMKQEMEQKPEYVKKSDIQIKSKKRKGVTINKIKTKLQSEINIRQRREESLKAKEEARRKPDEGQKKIKKRSNQESSDPLARFVKKKKVK